MTSAYKRLNLKKKQAEKRIKEARHSDKKLKLMLEEKKRREGLADTWNSISNRTDAEALDDDIIENVEAGLSPEELKAKKKHLSKKKGKK